jgi:DNA-dependent RNA polymerase auxiliary subunit epsilon
MAVRQIQQENGDKYMTTTLDEIDDKYLGAGRGKARKFINSNAYDKEFIQPIISSNN